MKLPALAITLAAFMSAGTARADDSADLVQLCEKYLALPKTTEVTAEYIQLKSSCAGFINSHMHMSKPEDGFCRPKKYDMDDLARVYMDWLKKNPDRIKEPTKVTMTAALTEVYPCPK